jgi:hypothetical protein
MDVELQTLFSELFYRHRGNPNQFFRGLSTALQRRFSARDILAVGDENSRFSLAISGTMNTTDLGAITFGAILSNYIDFDTQVASNRAGREFALRVSYPGEDPNISG